MSRESLGHFELLVLLALLRHGEEAYGVPIARAIEHSTGKPVILASVYNTLERLEEKGLVDSTIGQPTPRARRPRQTVFFHHHRGVARGQGREEGADDAVAGHSRPRGINMVCSRFALRLLARADASGTREALIGDLLEEISSGRSRWWLYQQLIGLYGLALAAHARHHARLTPCVVAVALGAVLLGGLSIASVGSVLDRVARLLSRRGNPQPVRAHGGPGPGQRAALNPVAVRHVVNLARAGS